jgi:hypothetical protein
MFCSSRINTLPIAPVADTPVRDTFAVVVTVSLPSCVVASTPDIDAVAPPAVATEPSSAVA